MSAVFKPGTRVFGASCTTEAVVVMAPAEPIDLRIGGHPVVLDVASRDPSLAVSTPADAAPKMGKRYTDAAGSIQLLCTKAGAGAFAIGDELCVLKDAKPLPSSD